MTIIAVAAAAASVVTVGVVNTNPAGDSAENSAFSAYADEIVAVARAAPRLLVSAAGWTAVRADEFGTENGEISFSDGAQTLDLFWRPVAQHQEYVDDRADSAQAPSDITVAGHEGTLFRYAGSEVVTALWIDGNHSVELRGAFVSELDFRGLAATVQAVDIETWLAALPASVVSPTDQSAAIAEMLAGIPMPAGFDETDVASGGISDRYQLGARVTGAIACGWLDIWVAADANGDEAAGTSG